MAKRLHSKQELKEYHSDRPNVDFVRYLGVLYRETLGSLVPIGADSLGSKLYLVGIVIDGLAQAKVRNFHLALMKNDVLRFQIEVNNPLPDFVQVF